MTHPLTEIYSAHSCPFSSSLPTQYDTLRTQCTTACAKIAGISSEVLHASKVIFIRTEALTHAELAATSGAVTGSRKRIRVGVILPELFGDSNDVAHTVFGYQTNTTADQVNVEHHCNHQRAYLIGTEEQQQTNILCKRKV